MIGRFQVMAVLQAARAYVLGLDLESAKSWGLARAIFYAAAKRGFRRGKNSYFKKDPPEKLSIKKEPIMDNIQMFYLGDESQYSVEIGGKRYFFIGKVIKPEDFDKNIIKRFKDKWEEVWKEALEIIKEYKDTGVLLSQRYFFDTIYKPRRDVLKEKWGKLINGNE